jgi:hypothetical protein
MMRASELKPQKTPITPGQKAAWENLAKELGDGLGTLQGASARDIVDAGLKALQEEAEKLLRNEAVKQAYEQFLFIAALTKEHNDNAS